MDKVPSKEFMQVCDLMHQIEHLSMAISPQAENFIEGLYHNLDPYEPFLNQCSKAQQTYLNDLWRDYGYKQSW